jgi:hypothetical protein
MSTDCYTVVGVSTQHHKTRVRFANDLVTRLKVLSREGHSDIRLVELDTAMTRTQCIEHLAAHPEFQDTLAQDAIAIYVRRNLPPLARAMGISHPAVARIRQREAERIQSIRKQLSQHSDAIRDPLADPLHTVRTRLFEKVAQTH